MKKVFSVLFFTIGLGLIYSSCCNGDNPPFFDYTRLQVAPISVASQPPTSYTAALNIIPDNISFVADAALPSLIPAAYGLSCPEPGREGVKHKIASISITADKDFDANYPAGTSLSPLFYYFFGPQKTLTEVDPLFNDFVSPEQGLIVYSKSLPADTTQAFQLTVRITKDNGTTAEGVIQSVKFSPK
ncbi:MAG: hypothetical protein IT259_19055 [Saprospiraceae bacterium]|nr:hypothetical protein [Saprospiraceae bacterium]